MTGGREKLEEQLRRAGLEIAGDWRVEEVLPPRSAWRPVVAWETEPTVAVRTDRADLVAELNAQWYRLASEAGILGHDGVFLLDGYRDWSDCSPRSWTRVRLTGDWDLAGVLGERPGQPEFMTLSLDGDTLVAATTEEDSVWLVTVDRLRERQEAAAEAAARETPQERAAAWASLMRGPKPTEKFLAKWAGGLSLNPAAPQDLPVRLLGKARYLLYRPQPPEVVAAALAHPEWSVRALAAEHQPDITPQQWSRLILGEEDTRRRAGLIMVAADRRAELPEDTCRRLATDAAARVRAAAAELPGLPASLATELVADPDHRVRLAVCRSAWPDLDTPARQALLDDRDGAVRTAALYQHHTDHPLTRSVFEAEDLDKHALRRLLRTCRLSRDLAEHLTWNGEPDERECLARNPQLAPDLVALLGEDPEERVRFAVSVRPELTEEQRSAIRIDFDPNVHHRELDWVLALHDDADAMRRLAASAHPLVRRSVARARHLPPDVVERLARDEDRVVHLFLAESCEDAPADLLLGVWRWWTGSFSFHDRPRSHPNFPRHGLLRYADDPSPRMRRLALDDPDSTPGLVERLSRDPDEEVRHRAATDERLSAASAVRLLEDPHHHIRYAAARHPRLPAHVLIRLLRDTETAETAAGNPALPVHVMRWMLDPLP